MKDTLPETTSFINLNKPFGDLAQRYLLAMLAREQKKARDLVFEVIDHNGSIKEIYLNVFKPVMYEIGRLWQTGKISVGQEHYCTNAIQVTMSMLYPRLFNGTSCGKRMLAACAQGELHEMGLRMVTDFFEMDGWNTDYLGANTPSDSIVRAIEEKSVDVLAISVTMYFNLEKAQEIINAVHRATGATKIKILLGGYPFKIDDQLWQKLGADGCADNAQEAIALAEKLTSKQTLTITQNSARSQVHCPVSQDTLTKFNSQLLSVEQEVLEQCLSLDNPQGTMGPGAEAMIRNGLGFISKMFQSSMMYGSEKIVEDELAWCKTFLPENGVSMIMILNTLERYFEALKSRLPLVTFEEVRPYLTAVIDRQRIIVKDIRKTNAR